MIDNNDNNDDSKSSCRCFSCNGKGSREKKFKEEKKWIRKVIECKSCNGKGIIVRTKRKNDDGSYRKKSIEKSYPNYISIGSFPLGIRNNPNLQIKDDEELCYLVGNWKIYQRLDRHRYSTDDIVTSWFACLHTKIFDYSSTATLYNLDIGCGLGSVLISNAWQLPNAKCLGIEAQTDRYDLAKRSTEYNVGIYSIEQQRINVLNVDLRTDKDFWSETYAADYHLRNMKGFDMITATPPYFPMTCGAAPANIESTGCLFELRGGVEDYCLAASKQLRRPTSSKTENPSFFVMCNTSLTSARVYASCHNCNMSIIKRLDVIPKEGKPVLFCVFVIVLNEWLLCSSTSSLFPLLSEYQFDQKLSIDEIKNDYRINNSVRGEIIESLTVRDLLNNHSPEYQSILETLGKPHSGNKEKYNI